MEAIQGRDRLFLESEGWGSLLFCSAVRCIVTCQKGGWDESAINQSIWLAAEADPHLAPHMCSLCWKSNSLASDGVTWKKRSEVP
jgi:hypothetical protein